MFIVSSHMDQAAPLSTPIVTIGREILDTLLAAAAASPDAEICGLLLGRPGAIEAVCAAANVAADRRRRFEIDPRVLIAAHRAARGGGPAVIGCYHSHPGGSALPSETDRADAEPGALWLIVAGGMARLWIAEAAGFRERPLVPR